MAADKEPAIAREAATVDIADAAPLLRDELPPVEDDQLGLLFLTCHPSLPPDARVALALKLVGGFSVGEIARAFLSQDARSRSAWSAPSGRCATSRSSFGMPEPGELCRRGSIRCSTRST